MTEAYIVAMTLNSQPIMHTVFLCMPGLYWNKRMAATHILVVMISTECRSNKPYALPIQCISYIGITVKQMRDVLNRVVSAMLDRGMEINGTNVNKCVVSVTALNKHFQDLFQMESIIVCECKGIRGHCQYSKLNRNLGRSTA